MRPKTPSRESCNPVCCPMNFPLQISPYHETDPLFPTIRGAPHSFTKNSGADGEVYPDLEHVSARLSRRLYPNEENITGQDKVHVYLTGMVDGSARYNSARMEGERVTKMKSSGDVLDQSRSTGTYPLNPGSSTQTSSSDYATGSSSSAGYSAAGLSSSSGYAATGYTPATGYTATSYTSTTGYTPTTTAGYTTTAYTPTTTAGYTVTTASSSGTGGAGGTTQWEWSSKYGRYYRYVNGEVEWGSGSHV